MKFAAPSSVNGAAVSSDRDHSAMVAMEKRMVSEHASTRVVMMGLAISAGSRPTFLASRGSVQPMDLAISTVKNMAEDTMIVTRTVSGEMPGER